MSRLNLGLHLFNGVRYWPYSLLHINTLSQSRRSSLLTEHENKIMKSVNPNTPNLKLPHLKVSEFQGIRSLVSSASSIDAIFLIKKGHWRVLVNFLKVLEPLLSLLQTPGPLVNFSLMLEPLVQLL